MAVTPTVLFQRPQQKIASDIANRIVRASSVSIVTGFATPGGIAMIDGPIRTNPQKLICLVVGAGTYPAFDALDDLASSGVAADRLFVHLEHTRWTGGRKNPFERYHPMLHSKIYYMELAGSQACAFIGSHNITSFALGGLNGEAAVLLEGPKQSAEFESIRKHIEEARNQAVNYSPALKEAYAWWWREFIEGLRGEVGIPQDWTSARTILIFASAGPKDRPKAKDDLYFEIPAGIEQIERLKTEVHLFLFATLPSDPWNALSLASTADAKYKCKVLGVENQQGNREIACRWRIETDPLPRLMPVQGGFFRPTLAAQMQQVRAEVEAPSLTSFDYSFEREKIGWIPEFFTGEDLVLPHDIGQLLGHSKVGRSEQPENQWKLVRGLIPPQGAAHEIDQVALRLAAPESGKFILVSLRRRRKGESHAQIKDL